MGDRKHFEPRRHEKVEVKEEVKKEAPITEELKEEPKKEVVEETKEVDPPTRNPEKAIVNTKGLNVRYSPEVAPTNIMCVLKENTELQVLSDDGEWANIYCVPTPGIEVTGFVMTEFIKRI